MKRVKTFLAVAVIGISVLSSTISSEAAGCGNWYIKKTYTPTCKALSCGPGLGLPLYRQKLLWTRKCVGNDNKITYPTKTTYKSLGCC